MPSFEFPEVPSITWRDVPMREVLAKIAERSARPLILVDGWSGSGKSTFADRLQRELKSNLVHSDDVSWHGDPIEWDQIMIEKVIEPWRAGEAVDYTPPSWLERGRAGSVRASGDLPLIIEGMASCRPSLMALADFSIWVETDPLLARERVIERDFANNTNGDTKAEVIEFADWWDALTVPFISSHEPWARADLVVSGTGTPLGDDLVRVSFRDS